MMGLIDGVKNVAGNLLGRNNSSGYGDAAAGAAGAASNTAIAGMQTAIAGNNVLAAGANMATNITATWAKVAETGAATSGGLNKSIAESCKQVV
jgi:hypothetical protein